MHTNVGRYWYSVSACLNRVAADRAEQVEEELVLTELNKLLTTNVNGLVDRGHFEAVQVAPGSSADVPDEAYGVRAIVLGITHSHNGRDDSDAIMEAREILVQRGNLPRIYRNVLVFLAPETRQLEGLIDAMRNVLAWKGIVRDTQQLKLTQSDSTLARTKLDEASETVKSRITEAWCYLLYPRQDGLMLTLNGCRASFLHETVFCNEQARDWWMRKAFYPNLAQQDWIAISRNISGKIKTIFH